MWHLPIGMHHYSTQFCGHVAHELLKIQYFAEKDETHKQALMWVLAFYLKDAVSNEKQAREFGCKQQNHLSKTNRKSKMEEVVKSSNIPFCSFDIFDITTGILCSAPPWGDKWNQTELQRNHKHRQRRRHSKATNFSVSPSANDVSSILTRKWSITLVQT